MHLRFLERLGAYIVCRFLMCGTAQAHAHLGVVCNSGTSSKLAAECSLPGNSLLQKTARVGKIEALPEQDSELQAQVVQQQGSREEHTREGKYIEGLEIGAAVCVAVACLALVFCLWAAGVKNENIPENVSGELVRTTSILHADAWTPKLNEDEELCKNTNLDEDTYGLAISSLIRDIMMIVNGEGTPALRLFRLMLSLGLVLGNIAIQLFLLVQIKTFCTFKAVHDIQETYDKYEFLMYGSEESHTTLTSNAKHRGLPEFFRPEVFDKLPEELKDGVCNIPLSQPRFFMAVLFVWTLTCIGEVKKVFTLSASLLIATPTGASMVGALQASNEEDDGDGVRNEKVIVHLTVLVKVVIAGLVLLPRLLITLYLLFLGSRWLAATNDFQELVLNAVALEFLLLLKNLLFYVLVPERNKRDLQHTEIMPPSKRQSASYWVFLGTSLWAFVAAVWCVGYTYKWQQVLPGYRWDVSEACAKWIHTIPVD